MIINKRININNGKTYISVSYHSGDSICEFEQVCKSYNIKIKNKFNVIDSSIPFNNMELITECLTEEQIVILSLTMPEINDPFPVDRYQYDQQLRDDRVKASMGPILDFILNYLISPEANLFLCALTIITINNFVLSNPLLKIVNFIFTFMLCLNSIGSFLLKIGIYSVLD